MVRDPEQVQWNLQADSELDKKARAAAKKAGMSLSAFIRAVVRGYLELPGGLK